MMNKIKTLMKKLISKCCCGTFDKDDKNTKMTEPKKTGKKS